MKVAFNRIRRDSPWGGGSQFLSSLADRLTARGHSVVYALEPDVNAIVMFDPRYEDGGFDVDHIRKFKRNHSNVKVLHRINDSDIPRGTSFLDHLNIGASVEIADVSVFISVWLQQYYISAGFPKGKFSSVIRNGCSSVFEPGPVRSLHDPVRIVTHHWSANYNKGFDAYIQLDQLLEKRRDLTFTYVGRYNQTYSPRNTKIVPPLFGKELADELRSHDLYLTAARHEACGMHHVEAAACGLPIVYHKDGGGVVEMCSRYGVEFSRAEGVEAAIDEALSRYDDLRERVRGHSLSDVECCDKYVGLLESL